MGSFWEVPPEAEDPSGQDPEPVGGSRDEVPWDTGRRLPACDKASNTNSCVPGTQEGQAEGPGTLSAARLVDGCEGSRARGVLLPGGAADREGRGKGRGTCAHEQRCGRQGLASSGLHLLRLYI